VFVPPVPLYTPWAATWFLRKNGYYFPTQGVGVRDEIRMIQAVFVKENDEPPYVRLQSEILY
jgi:hypothetical protein